MKIITNTKLYGKVCYVQVKDVLFLARYTGNKRLMQDYLNSINNGKSDNEFIKVSGDSYIRAFELCDYIIDFSEYSRRDIGVNYLSNMVKTKIYAMPKDKRDQEGLDYQIEGVRDIISYKRGELDYRIPLVPNGKIEILSKDKRFVFESTIIDGCFSLKTVDGSDIEKSDYQLFLDECIDRTYTTLYSDCDERDFSTFVTGNTVVLNVKKHNVKKKKGVVSKILAKIKKED
ncbi:MAG: hypothetical protein IKM55_00500 [Bacilli bacterium]|nr:hypothetical protein [Bacilli bacterium]